MNWIALLFSVSYSVFITVMFFVCKTGWQFLCSKSLAVYIAISLTVLLQNIY